MNNERFKQFQNIIVHYPFRVIVFIHLMMLPTQAKSYGIGVLRVSYAQYFCPTLLTAPIMSSFRIFLGSRLVNIYDLQSEKNYGVSFQKELVIIISLITGFIIFWCFINFLISKSLESIHEDYQAQRNSSITN